MYWKLLKNDIINNRLQSFNIAFFIVLSVAFLAVAAQLAIRLNTSVSTLFKKAKTPHLLQMPTGALDSKTGQEVLELFYTFHAEGKSILMGTHDVQVHQGLIVYFL
jgi:ABC superfamily ATP binding cassette transporter, membrane protein